MVWFYNQRAGAENLIKEANNDAGLAAHPSRRFDMNRNHFQLAMLAYNLNCWLLLFNREAQASVETLRHTTLATARLRFLFVAAKIWRHAGRTGVSYSDQYEEKGLFERLMPADPIMTTTDLDVADHHAAGSLADELPYWGWLSDDRTGGACQLAGVETPQQR